MHLCEAFVWAVKRRGKRAKTPEVSYFSGSKWLTMAWMIFAGWVGKLTDRQKT